VISRSARRATSLLLVVSLALCAIAGELVTRFPTTRTTSRRGDKTKHDFNPEPVRAACDRARCFDQTALFTHSDAGMY